MATSSTLTPKTLFVVGAGASKEVGLPIGSELKNSIVRVLTLQQDHRGREFGDEIILRTLNVLAERAPAKLNSYYQACQRICNAMPQVISIDNFINQHRNDKHIEQCGKLAIVRAILEAESKSSLYINPSNIYNKMNFVKLESTWFTSFWKLLTENCSRLELEQRFKSVVFVIFNYDRCIEHYLYHSLQNTYPMSESEAAQLIKCIEIYHPYGTVGHLPWLSSANSIMYGGTPNSDQLQMLASQIKTFTEGTDESSSEVNAIRSKMEMSNRFVFLGFAFHKLNMDLLFPTEKSNAIKSSRHVYATAQDISASDIKSITTTLINKGKVDGNNIYVQNDLTCYQLFRAYWRSIAFV